MIYFALDYISNRRSSKSTMLERIKEFKFQKSASRKQINNSLQNNGLQIAQEFPDDFLQKILQTFVVTLFNVEQFFY
jgi:sulfatase maturation enzyme AslB (radical SAM superfamily)